MITNGSSAISDEPERRSVVDAMRPRWQEVTVVLAASLVSLIGVSLGTSVPQFFNIVVPVLLSIGLFLGAISMVRIEPGAIWAPLFWVRIVMIAYSGVGSVVPFIANDVTLDIIDRFFALYPVDMMKYNAVVAVFSLTMLIAAWIICWLIGTDLQRRVGSAIRIQSSALDAKQFGLLALIVALPIKVLSQWMSFFTGNEVAIPATFSMIGMLTLIAYPLLIYHALKNDRRLLWLPIPFILFEAGVGVLTFNKTEALFPLIFAFIGVLFHRATFRRLVIGASVIVLFYWVLVPFVSWGRGEQIQQTGSIESSRLSTSLEISLRYDPTREGPGPEEMQGGLARLSYINGGSYAISQYDQGIRGGTLDNALIVLVPRVIYPDKPSVTQIFRDFNYALTGSDESQSAPGIPPEAYWNYGWLGVFAVASIMGAVYALWSFYAIATLQAGAWHLLFVSLLGVRVASRIDGMIATDFIPIIPIAIVVHFLLSFGNSVLLGRRSRSRSRSGRTGRATPALIEGTR